MAARRSGCYTYAGPAPTDIAAQRRYLKSIANIAGQWADTDSLPSEVAELWSQLLSFSETELYGVKENARLVSVLLQLFAIADETCKGMGWRAAPAVGVQAVAEGTYRFDDLVIASVKLKLADKLNLLLIPFPFQIPN